MCEDNLGLIGEIENGIKSADEINSNHIEICRFKAKRILEILESHFQALEEEFKMSNRSENLGKGQINKIFKNILTQIDDDNFVFTQKLISELNKAITNEFNKEKGLYNKYRVYKGNNLLKGCFVLRPARDLAARGALRTYATQTTNRILAEDIFKWLDSLCEVKL